MNTKNTIGHSAAADQVRAVIESLDREGSIRVMSRNPRADFRTVSITTGEAEAIRKWVIDENATHTIEIGLAFGFSALHICEGLLLNVNPDPKHVKWISSGLTRIFDRDLAAACIPKYDERNRVVDVHALRVTFGTHLCAAGVALRTAQAAMRHSKPELTANIYTDPKLLDVAGAINALPELALHAAVAADRAHVQA